MKNSTYAYTYTIGLSITHPTRELSYLVDELNKIPNGKVGKGLGKNYDINRTLPYEEIKTSDIGFELDYGWYSALFNEDLPEAIEKLIAAVSPYKDLLLEVANSGGNIRCDVGWHMDTNIGTSFSPQLLHKLADFQITLNVSVYMNDEMQKLQSERLDRIAEKMRTILHKYDPSKVIDKAVPLSELYHDPYQDLFDVLPYFIKFHASNEILVQELKEELAYFNRTNTPALKDFADYGALADELSKLEWE